MPPHSLSKLDPNKSRLNFYQQNTSTPVTIDTSQQSFVTFPPTSSPLPPKSPLPPPLPTKQPPPIMPKPSSQALLANQNKKPLPQQQDPRGEQYKIETLKNPPKVLSTVMPLNSGASAVGGGGGNGGGGNMMWQKASSLENLDGFIDIDDGGETEEVTPSNLSKYNYGQQQQQQTRYLKEQEEHFSQHEVTTQEIRQMYERKNIILTTPVVNPINNNNNNNSNRKLNTHVRRSVILARFVFFC